LTVVDELKFVPVPFKPAVIYRRTVSATSSFSWSRFHRNITSLRLAKRK